MAELMVWIVEALLQLSMVIMVGLYFIFSNTVMWVLSKNSEGALVMVEINKQILNPFFLACFGLSGLAGLYFFLFGTGFQPMAGLLFFIGTTLVTVLFNAPWNNKLKDATKDNLVNVWERYLTKWVYWNHVRTLSAIASSFMLFL